MKMEILKLAHEGALNRLDYYTKKQEECVKVYGKRNKIYENLIKKFEDLYNEISREMIHE